MDVSVSFFWTDMAYLQVIPMLSVDCCSTTITFAQYIQEASFEEVETLVKAATEYKDQCLANVTLPQCSKLAVSKLFALLKQTSSFVNTDRNFALKYKKRDALCPSFVFGLAWIFRIRQFPRRGAILYYYAQENLAMSLQS